MEGVHSEEEETCLQILQSCEIKSIPNQDRGHYDGKKVNVPLVFRKRKNDYRPISLTSMPWNVMEEVLREATCRYLMDQLSGNS